MLTLPGPITVGEVRIDPSSGCGDPAASALGGYVLQVSATGAAFSTVAQGTFGSANVGRTNAVALSSRPAGVRFVKLRALSSQGGSPSMDVAEIQISRRCRGHAAASAPPPPDRRRQEAQVPDLAREAEQAQGVRVEARRARRARGRRPSSP